mmetsp:Transcript_146429/g.355421  ORF Transcript_146429/g.355421 Transcript_146429/m.355421 type:complete len:325 (-) Transcript_146429:90-1064(-)
MAGEELLVNVHLDPELSLPPIVKALWPGATVADLKASLAQDDPTGQMRVEDFDLAALSAASRPLPGEAVVTWELLDVVICAPREEATVAVAAGEEAWPQEAWHGEAWPQEAWHGEASHEEAACEEALPEQRPREEEPALGPCEYRVVQGPLVKKPGTQGPGGAKIVKLSRKVGATFRTTGQTWTGPAGGEWVELDPVLEKPGWLLVEGPGFDLPGPLLERVAPDEETPMVLSLFSAIAKVVLCDVLVRPSQKVSYVQKWINLKRGENLPQNKVWCVKATPEETEGKVFLKTMNMLSPSEVLGNIGFRDGDTFVYVIIGKDGDFC